VSDEGDVIEHGRFRPSRRSPLFPRRPPARILAIAVALVAAGVIAVIVFVPTGSSSEARAYSSVPDACTLVSAKTAKTYAPQDPSAVQEIPPQAVYRLGPQQNRATSSWCTWSGLSGNALRDLFVSVDLYSSSRVATTARYVLGDRLGARRSVPVPGLGDHAVAELGTLAAGNQEVDVVVWSSNAVVTLSYQVWALQGPAPLTLAAQLTDVTAIARDTLHMLAHPASAAPPSAQPGPRYPNPPHPCALLPMATVTRYVPGATRGTELPNQDLPVPGSSPWGPGPLSSQLPAQAGGQCLWSANAGSPRQAAQSLGMDVSIHSSATGATDAEQNFEADVQSEEQGIRGSFTVTGNQPVTGLGQQATAVYSNLTGYRTPVPCVTLLTWSGNAELVVTYTVPNARPSHPIPNTALLAAATTVTRDVLTTLSR
jgi:hypothetical protein